MIENIHVWMDGDLEWQFYLISFQNKIGELVPAKAIPSKQIAYIPHGGDEIPKYDYHVSGCSGKIRR